MGEVVGTFKANGDPWVVIHAETAEEYVNLVDASIDGGVFEATGRAEAAMRSRLLLGSGLGAVPIGTQPNQGPQDAVPYSAPPQQSYGQPAQQYAPQNQGYGQQPQIPQLPPGESPVRPCPHGGKQWKAGINKQGRPYGMWACPAPRDQQCQAEFPAR